MMPTQGLCGCPACAGGLASGDLPYLSAASESAVATNGKPIYSEAQVVDNLLRWNARWSDDPIPYVFYTAKPPHQAGNAWYNGFLPFTEGQKTAARLALTMIADVADIRFVEIPDDGIAPSATNRRFTFANSTTVPNYVTVGGTWVQPTPDFPIEGELHQVIWAEALFTNKVWAGGLALGQRPFYGLLHEILHGLGLPHPGEYNRNADEPITYAKHAEYFQDSGQYTVMSYFSASLTGAFHTAYTATLLLHDIAAMQALYGPNMASRTGDTVYGYGSTAGLSAYDFNSLTQPVVAIWDAGGRDTLDLSGAPYAVRLDLREGAFSDTHGMTSNLAIAFGARIEDAVGSAFDDTVIGNAYANKLTGGSGNDRLDGREGDDLLLGGLGADVFIFRPGSGHDRAPDFDPMIDLLDLSAVRDAGLAWAEIEVLGGRILIFADGSMVDLGEPEEEATAYFDPPPPDGLT